jgi:HEAT repeat protein
MSDAIFDSKFVKAVEEIDFPSDKWRYLLSANNMNDNSIGQQLQKCGFAVKEHVDRINGQTTDLLMETYLQGSENAEAALAALQIRTSKSDKDKVIKLIDSDISNERALAVKVLTYRLGESFQSEIVPKLYELSKKEQECSVLEALCYAMYHLGADEKVSHLKHLVNNSSSDVRFALAACFFGTDEPDGINCLVSLSRDEVPEVRNWAVTALGQSLKYMDDPNTIKKTFTERLDDEERSIRLEALSALSKLQDKDEKALNILISELNSDPVPLIAIESAIMFASPSLNSTLENLLQRTEVDDPNISDIKQAINACLPL